MKISKAFYFALLACACGGSKSTAPAADTQGPNDETSGPPAVELVDTAKVYRGQEGLTVTMAPVVGSDDMVIVIDGLQSEVAGIPLRYSPENRGRDRIAYVTTLRGEDSYLVHGESDRVGYYTVYLPESGSVGRPVSYDEEATEKASAAALASEFSRRTHDGTIARLAAFDRKEREAYNDTEYLEEVKSAEKACGTSLGGGIRWDSVDDETIKDKSIASYCGSFPEALGELCDAFPVIRSDAAARIQRIECVWGKPGTTLDAGTLVWSPGESNLDEVAWDDARRVLDYTQTVLRAGDDHVILDPGDADSGIWYGDDKTFHRHRKGAASAGWSTRYLWNGAHESRLVHDDHTWTLTCDDDEHPLEELGRSEREKILANAKLGGQLFDREPYALARDDRGNYYYIDRLSDDKGGKGFRVFIGPRGGARPTRLMDIVEDSKGVIFSTRSGSLRLVVSRGGGSGGSAVWIKGKKRQLLTVLPLHTNRALIYEQLGVYTSEPLGTLCQRM